MHAYRLCPRSPLSPPTLNDVSIQPRFSYQELYCVYSRSCSCTFWCDKNDILSDGDNARDHIKCRFVPTYHLYTILLIRKWIHIESEVYLQGRTPHKKHPNPQQVDPQVQQKPIDTFLHVSPSHCVQFRCQGWASVLPPIELFIQWFPCDQLARVANRHHWTRLPRDSYREALLVHQANLGRDSSQHRRLIALRSHEQY